MGFNLTTYPPPRSYPILSLLSLLSYHTLPIIVNFRTLALPYLTFPFLFSSVLSFSYLVLINLFRGTYFNHFSYPSPIVLLSLSYPILLLSPILSYPSPILSPILSYLLSYPLSFFWFYFLPPHPVLKVR